MAGGVFASDVLGLVGVRLMLADGPHFGWVKFTRPCTKPWVPFDLDSYALHPLPDTPIPAGAFPQPTLEIQRSAGDAVTLSWRPEWTGFRLEWAQVLSSSVAWKPVDGVVNNPFTLPASTFAGYFRLVKSP